MTYHELCQQIEQWGPYMSDVIGKCRRHVLSFQGTGTSRIDKYLRESATYAAAEQGRDLRAEFESSAPEPGFLLYLEDRQTQKTFQFPVWVNERAGIVKQANGEAYGLLEDVWDCLHLRVSNGQFIPWRSANPLEQARAQAPAAAEVAASDSQQSTVGTQPSSSGRRLQSQWRKRVEALYGSRCVLTGCSHRALLRAAHIKRWADSTTQERLDPNNGLILAAHIDAAFEVGLIAFDPEGRILISPQLSTADRKILNLTGREQLTQLTTATQHYLAQHRLRFVGDPQ